ncbi:MAG TPA: ribonuclease HI [Bdellovibrionota bacterium]|nr:ribonuclease HI [Bdellovibrionota bacterium]
MTPDDFPAKTKPKQSLPIIVFADGASSGNPGPGGWGAIVGLPNGVVRELGGGERQTTNNRMELMGVIRALEFLKGTPGEVDICTDSTYVIKGITQWVWGWRKRDWKTAEGKDVANAELWKALFAQVSARRDLGKIEWKYVRGHAGNPGNERVDEIAVAYSKGQRPSLYAGPLLKYPVALYDLPESTELPPERPREAKVAAFSYLSLIGGIAERHTSWADCERRVKGRSGAKFKKAM